MSQFNFNDVIEWGALNETEREEVLRRPAVMAGDRIKTAGDILSFTEFFVADEALPYDEADFAKQYSTAGASDLVRGFRERIAVLERFEPAALEEQLKAYVIHPLRLAVTGKSVGLGLYEALAILGRGRSLARIDRALAKAG